MKKYGTITDSKVFCPIEMQGQVDFFLPNYVAYHSNIKCSICVRETFLYGGHVIAFQPTQSSSFE